MNFKQDIGLHLRIKDSLPLLLEEAEYFNLKLFQFFLVQQKSNAYITTTKQDRDIFIKNKNDRSMIGFIHCSYWINPSSGDKKTLAIAKKLLRKEIALAKALDIRFLVLHAGSAKGFSYCSTDEQSRKYGVYTLAKTLNSLLKKEDCVQILVENGAHGKKTVGSNLEDLALLRSELLHPEKVGFCLDTAHAHSFGYDITATKDFLTTVDTLLGFDNIKLIHFNDSEDVRGSMEDRHAFPAYGKIGKDSLNSLLQCENIKNTPKIIESPLFSKNQTLSLLQTLEKW